ncbi:MAG: hypothetical protein ABIG84_03140 [archaeon]
MTQINKIHKSSSSEALLPIEYQHAIDSIKSVEKYTSCPVIGLGPAFVDGFYVFATPYSAEYHVDDKGYHSVVNGKIKNHDDITITMISGKYKDDWNNRLIYPDLRIILNKADSRNNHDGRVCEDRTATMIGLGIGKNDSPHLVTDITDEELRPLAEKIYDNIQNQLKSANK